MVDPVTGYITTLETTVELATGGFAPFEQLQWYGNNGTQFRSYSLVLVDIGQAVLSTTGKNCILFTLVDKSSFQWKNPAIVRVPGPRYQWVFSVGWTEIYSI